MNLNNFKNLKFFNFNNDLYGRLQPIYDGAPIDLENINVISEGDIEYDASLMKIIQKTRLIIKMSEVIMFGPGDSSEINKIPELFFNK